MSAPIVLPKYEPRCERCGHSSGVHSTTNCANLYRTLDREAEAVCDCTGWKRDAGWPPPSIIERVK